MSIFKSQLAKRNTEVIALISIAHASSHFYHLVIPSLFPWLIPAFGLDYIEAGFPVTVFFVVSAVGQSASGFLVEKIGAKNVLLSGLALLALSAFVLGSSVSYWMVVLAAITAGLGNCVFHASDFCLISSNVTKKWLGHAFAWHGITGNLGWAICPLFMVTISNMAGWRIAAYAASSVAILIFLLIFIRSSLFNNQEEEETEADRAPKAQTTFGFLRDHSVWLCFMFFFLTSGAFGILQSYGPTLFKKVYDLNLTLASTALTCYLVGSGVGGILGGFIVSQNRISRDKVVAGSLTFSACMAFLIASQIVPSWMVIPLMACMGFGVGVANPSRDVLIRETTINRLGTKILGRVYGFVYCGMDVGQSISPVLFGTLLDHGYFTITLASIAALQLCAVFTALNVGSAGHSSSPQSRQQA